jgi:hypothetical protein
MFLHIRGTEASRQMVFFSPYNSQSVTHHEWYETVATPHGEYIKKRQMGLVSVFFEPQDLLSVGLFDEKPNDEAAMADRMKSLGLYNVTTSKSLVEHIGETSILNKYRPSEVPRADFSFQLSPEDWITELHDFTNPTILRDLRPRYFESLSTGQIPSIQVLIMVHPKDLHLVTLCLSALKENCLNPISEIFIVGPKDLEQKLSGILNVNFLDESKLQAKKFKYFLYPQKEDRGNWLFQQFCKLNVDTLPGGNLILILDVDNILIKPQIFATADHIYLPVSHEFHKEYFFAYSRIMRAIPTNTCSNIRHFMVFDKVDLRLLKQRIEDLHGKSWDEAIYSNLDLTESSCFSEFELYGHWAASEMPEKYLLSYYDQIELPSKYSVIHQELSTEYHPLYYGIAYPSWKLQTSE